MKGFLLLITLLFAIQVHAGNESQEKIAVLNVIKNYLITIMIQPLRTILRVSCSGGFNHGQEQGSVSKKHEYSCLY